MVVLDGISDRPVPELSNQTPLEKARTTALNKIAKKGINGIMDPISPGIRPGSDTSHLSLLGYNPRESYSGRGPFEAAGAGIDVKEGDIAFRCNYATKKNGKIIDRRANRIRDTKEIARSIKEEIEKIEDVEIIFEDSTAHRAALVLRGSNLSDKVTDSDPKRTNVKAKKVSSLEKEAQKTTRILNKFVKRSEKILKNHPVNEQRKQNNKSPANTLLIRGAGKVPEIEGFEEKFGFKGAIISATGLIQGIGKVIDLDVIEPEGTTGGYDSNLMKKAESTKKMLEDHDFVLLHIKGGDEVSHDGDYEKKLDFIKNKIDPAIEEIINSLGEETLTVLTADHSTPISIRDHSADPVPLSIMGKETRKDEVDRFDENTHRGGLNRIRGKDLFPICLDLVDRTKKFGA